MGKVKVRVKKPWCGYPGSTIQNNFGEYVDSHGFFLWDIDRGNVDIAFHELTNPGPFLTIDWIGYEPTIAEAERLLRSYAPTRCRVRIRADNHVSQKDAQSLTSRLKATFDVHEVVFKTDATFSRTSVSVGDVDVARTDLRNVDVLLRLIRDFHANRDDVSTDDWLAVRELLQSYVTDVADELNRGTKWSLRRLSFDNTFAYGEGNVVDFEALSGIVGVFGPNRVGKSSLIGTMVYSLFNGTDRGSIKNLHVVNVRKPHCLARAIVNVAGTDYVIERQTVKNENKKKQVNAATSLNVFRVQSDGSLYDMVGEQRSDTEKVIRGLIGTQDDFKLTSLATQGDLDQFIKHGSTRRHQYLSKFLDLDAFAATYDLANKECNLLKSQLKVLASVDLDYLNARRADLASLQEQEACVKADNLDQKQRLAALTDELRTRFGTQGVVSSAEISLQEGLVSSFDKRLVQLREELKSNHDDNVKLNVKLEKLRDVKSKYDIKDLREKSSNIRRVESSLKVAKVELQKDQQELQRTTRSLKILDDVPCGDQYPTCRFIKDAHEAKSSLREVNDKVSVALEQIKGFEAVLRALNSDEIDDQVSKMEQLLQLESDLQKKQSTLLIDGSRLEARIEKLDIDHFESTKKLSEMRSLYDNTQDEAQLALRKAIDEVTHRLDGNASELITLASRIGKLQAEIELRIIDYDKREGLLKKLKQVELISLAVSKKGLPSSIVNSQLPVINAEIAKILHGIVDYDIELEVDESTDSLEIYLNYGDSRRIIELASGMEKVIASIAIRVALINVSSLPKTDMFIIDEGFGALDDAGVEACNRLLSALKQQFRLVLIVSHVEGIKDAADIVLDISKVETDARLVYDGTN